MRTVVSSINYDDLWGHDGTWACSHSTTTVPDETDLSFKADKAEVLRMQRQLQALIADNSNKLVVLEGKQGSFVEKRVLEELKERLLDNARLKEERETLIKVGFEIIERIKRQCDKERNAISKEIESFSNLNMNEELKVKLAPIEGKISKIIDKIELLNTNAKLIEQKRQEIEKLYNDYKRIIDNLAKYSESIGVYKKEYSDLCMEYKSCVLGYKKAIQQISVIQSNLQNIIQKTVGDQVIFVLTSLSFWKRLKWFILGHL